MTEEEYKKSVEESKKAAHEETMWGKPARDILTGISNNSNVRPVRAIWELVQNARDVVKPECRAKIKFIRNNDELIFQHDGIPFTHKTIEALILQTSSKAVANNVEVGQYGTGFLTTHKFGLKFTLTAPLRTSESFERYYKIQGFEIDRSTTDKETMLAAIKDQWKETKNWGLDYNETTENPFEYTIFKYQHESEKARLNAEEAFKEAPDMAPYVLLLNPQIERIEFIDQTKTTSTKVNYVMPRARGEKVDELQDGTIYKNTISIIDSNKGEDKLCLYYIESSEKIDNGETQQAKVTVILPVKEENDGSLHVIRFGKNVPQIYLYLPLLGTEQWGFNYLFHSPQLTCDRDSRDSLRLVGNGQNNDHQAQENREIIDLVNKLIWQFIENKIGELKDAKNLVSVNFKIQQSDKELAAYYTELQKLWRERYETLSIVETNGGGQYKINDIYVLDEKLRQDCDCHPELLDAIFKLIDKANKWIVPKKEDMVYWSHTINEWYGDDENPHQLSIDTLVKGMPTDVVTKEELGWLHVLCAYILETKRTDLLGQVKLIPNDKLVLQYRDVLKKPVKMAGVVRSCLEVMAADEVATFVHPLFCDVINDTVVDYPQIKEYITNYMNNHNNEQNGLRSEIMRQRQAELALPTNQRRFNGEAFKDKGYETGVVQCMLNMLLSLLPEDTNGFGGKVLPLFEEFYSLKAKAEEGRLDKVYGLDDRAFYNAMIYDSLFKFTLSDQKNEKKDWIKKMVEVVYGHSDSKPFLANYQVYPDQTGEFKYAEWLKKQPEDTPDRALEIYDAIMRKSPLMSIKTELVDKDYNNFFQGNGELKSVESLREIEDAVAKRNYSLKGYEHWGLIVEIIKHQSSGEADAEQWKHLFADIEKNKGQLMFSTLEDQSKKDSLFSLIEIEDAERLELVAKLAKEPRLERLYDLGKKALLIEERDENDKDFKLKLGKFVEEILLKELNQQLGGVSLTVDPIEDEQYGQDMVLRVDGEDLYYIEVKSRWSSDKSVLMSTMQHRRSYEKKDCYALCAVDMVGTGTDIEDVKAHRYPAFDQVESHIQVLMHIGELNERLKDATENSDGKVHVNGGYQVLVSQKVIENNSVSFSTFVEGLKKVVLLKLEGVR